MPTVKSAIRDFVNALGDNLNSHELERFFAGDKTLTSRDLGNQPEPWTEHNLIWPILDAVDLDKDPQPYGAGDRPDFELLNIDVEVIGENKSPNNIDVAEDEIKGYLRDKALGADHGIATDGITWVVYKIELGGDFVEFPEIARIDLRRAMTQIAADNGHITGLEDINVDEELSAFTDVFERDAFNRLLTTEAPQRIREERKRDVEDFYDLYIELLFGAGDRYEYDTTLINDITAPYGAGEREINVFAITLLNRLLFIKFLEERGVLVDGFLLERVNDYEENRDNFAGSLYDTQIQPLFYSLLNTPEEDRDPKHLDEDKWFSDVPYLNGGLFRANVPNESEYRVKDRILSTVVTDLIEGTALESNGNGNGMDPAVIGSVFEKTINFIEQERDQKDIGAYYTPNDITSLITGETVDRKVREEILDAYASEVSVDADAFLESNEDKELEEILRDIEDSAGWFGNPDATRIALDRLNDLTVLDPACGSGHFLTTALDEIHRVQVSLIRGLHGDDPSPREVYEAKKDLALKSIYGVDIEPVGVEIAKLRTWLKIVEDGWHEGYGRLPNIDVNISAGNSLIGLPITGARDTRIDLLDLEDRIADLIELRRAYKYDDAVDPREIQRVLREDLRPELDELYLQQQNYSVATTVTDVEEFEMLVESISDDHLFPSIESVKVVLGDGGSIAEEEEEGLEELGFSVFSKSARLDIRERERALRDANHTPDPMEQITSDLTELLNDGFVFDEVVRKPCSLDLETALGPPFHWVAEFPEVADVEDMSMNFDLILGNPPYGDILDDADNVLVSGYETGGVPDISAQFVERQLQLLADDGYFGNITTLRLIVQSSLGDFHDMLRDKMDYVDITSFGYRPSYVFDNAEIQVGIFTGKRNVDADGEISTSKFIWLIEDERKQQLDDITFKPVDGFVLTDKIGGRENYRTEILPKIGNETNREFLEELKTQSSTVFRDKYDRNEENDYAVWRREGLLYFVNPMLEELYDAREVKPMYFDSELEQKTAFMVLNSSLFYLYWVIYGNQRHLNWGQIEAFPWPDEDTIEEYADRIKQDADELWDGLKDGFDEEMKHFHSRAVKPLIDDFDRDVIGDLYGLNDEQVAFLTEYHTEYGRKA